MDGPRLRLVREPVGAAALAGGVAVDEETGALKFPGAVRDVVGRPDPRRVAPADAARMAQRSLDDMQALLDSLRHEAGSLVSHDLPNGDGPRAA